MMIARLSLIAMLAVASLIPARPALAQDATDAAELSQQVDDDRGFITRFLENNLSSAGRAVRITGFQGALSSRATFDELTVADDQGVWLTIRDGAIQWNRSALLRRRIEIGEMTAGTILIPRRPVTEDTDGPTLEVGEFRLPELPVAVQIDQIAAERVEIGEAVFGAAAAVALKGTMSLEGGEGTVDISANRLDAARGTLSLVGSYANATRNLNISMLLDEAADGIAAGLLDLPGRPELVLAVNGTGPIDDFNAQIQLATDGQDRMTGTVTTARATGPAPTDTSPGRRFTARLDGDISPLVSDDSRAFFGQQSQLMANGWLGDDGAIDVPVLMIRTGQANLSGALNIPANGMPQTIALMLNVAPGARPEDRTRLPFGDIELRSGQLQFSYDRAEGEGWVLDGRLADLRSGDVSMRSLRLAGDGVLRAGADGDMTALDGVIDFAAAGIASTNEALAQAVGGFLAGRTGLTWTEGGALSLSDISVTGDGYAAEGTIDLDSPGEGVIARTALNARYDDFGRLSGLAGRSLGGQAAVSVNGAYTVLTGAFDGRATVTGTDVTVDHEQLDKLLTGDSSISVDARRDADGILLRGLTIDADQLVADAKGKIGSGTTDLTANLALKDLVQLDPDWGGALTAEASLTETVTSGHNVRRLSLNGVSDNLRIGIAEIDSALRGTTNLVLLGQESGGVFTIDTFRAANPQLTAEAKGTVGGGASDATASVAIPDLAALGRGWGGSLNADAALVEKDGVQRLTATGSGQDIRLGQQDVDGALTGLTRLDLAATRQGDAYAIERFDLTNDQMQATAQGTIGDGRTDATARLNIANLAAFGRGWRGAVQADASFADAGDGARRLSLTGTGQDLSLGQANVDGALTGRTDFTVQAVERDGTFTIDQARIDNRNLQASATGTVGAGQNDLAVTANVADLSALGLGVRGGVQANGTVQGSTNALRFAAQGQARNLAIGQPQADAVLAGATSFDLAGRRDDGLLRLDRLRVQNPQLTVTGDGIVDGGARRFNLDARLADLGLVAADFPGPATVAGTIAESGRGYDLNLRATAPGNTSATITGPVAADASTADLRINGSTNAALISSMMQGRAIEGPVAFDLRLNGRPALESLSGQVRADALRVADPRLGISLPRVSVTADLGGGRVMVAGSADVGAGGQIVVAGPVNLTGDQAADLTIALNGVVLRDPNLYQTTANGQLRLTGPLAGGAALRGTVGLTDTEIRIPSTGLGSSELLEGVRHVGDRPPVRITRQRALTDGGTTTGAAGRDGAPPARPITLDVLIEAPNQVFVRGRGLDAELGGQIRIAGTTDRIQPMGEMNLIRGRLDILGKRFVLSEGRINLEGGMIPTIRFVATTQNDSVTSNVIIDGPADQPQISFTSDPEMAEEEVIAQLLFSRNLSNISAFQAAQLASAIATLAGRGGEGIVGNLRNSFGLDDLDVSTSDSGEVTVRAGRYLTENVYTDVEVDSAGDTKLNLNLDIRPGLKARGSVASDGGSSLGLFYERDY
ncbi:translocation/assembly module TamB domain-containing protein [Paracoccus sp. p3-h83]|uniref:translocation/assembly module TamB domain-containing protein n=1 Tax=Paracoccus sp. p3-h83 TaxID=3342805 RepID=UPI0035BADBC9